MSLSLQEVEHIAQLARLDLSEAEKARYRLQLSAILDYVAQLQKLDTASIPPTASIFGAASPLRPDEPRPGLTRDELLKNAPEREAGQFKIPPVFGDGTPSAEE
ncbi:MAG: Asp-tRNA(Asn)/Glu-tRNA(Gln) amidotransferase GatCAB subunit C [Anaerolineae bacterium CG_4_9_14_3_um_filter_57_17]|nr:Asp-tRNA(Asn)/Glu-tRNA(Gln) amidotransferase subunit GatC [bacterium]NCT19860.1 Asp-tRNA(Asn)/Glu-tRNA(Gln) amidotransferase subunit GatC [bacterium]OIO83517.1 MAG: asparaginyl/glutamyl-tRNA amidotransferase subunit C [Anaerolineae bacterium CG2_30_57_67]PJB67263.1 MAG: Asp-tRNA(Asn)/Glu-tRNA(Gln) amidotransferase GatCAB subunit C [Anaerolineae bacterium CG_4_9_14_3_um_filter_57_17]